MLSLSEIERFYRDEPPNLLEIILELRNLIFSVAPTATEIIQWKGLSYYDASRGGTVSAGICQIRIVEDCVQLGFVQGVFLPDPQGLLSGSGKAKRVMSICAFETAPWEAIKTLIEASSQFDPYSLSENSPRINRT